MLCSNCRENDQKPSETAARLSWARALASRRSASAQRRCERCGTAVVGPDSVADMMRKLAQLERFGLAGRDRAVLEPKRGSSTDSEPQQ